MSNFKSITLVSGGQSGTEPAIFSASTVDNLATITATGYLDDLNHLIKENDFIWINYNDASTFPLYPDGISSNYGQFTVTVSGANTSLVQNPATTNIPSLATVAITAAEFNGMYAAPKLLIAAGGANTLIAVTKMDLIMTYGGAAFAAGGVVHAQYDSTANGAGVSATNTEVAADFQATASTTFQFEGAVGDLPFSTTVNKGLYLSNDTAAFTTGTSNFVAKIYYYLLPTA